MPGRRCLSLLALAAALAATTVAAAGAAAPKRTFTLTPRPQYVTGPIRIAGKHWPLCGSVRLTVKPRNAPLINVARVAIRPDGSFARTWYSRVGMGGTLVRIGATATCGKRVVASSSLILILNTP